MAQRSTARDRDWYGSIGRGVKHRRRQGIETVEAEGSSPLYLLFAGPQQSPRGGLADLVETFNCEETARTAFREMRLRMDSAGAWAQLAVVNQKSGIRPLCWFGIGATPNHKPTSSWRTSGLTSRRTTRPLRLRSGVSK